MSAVLTGVALGAVLISPSTDACTTLVLPATDHTRIYARTMEFAMDTKSRLVGLPRNLPLTGQKGLVWKAKYAVTGMNVFNMPAMLDGMNEKGLTGGALYFPGQAGYTAPGEVGAGQTGTMGVSDLGADEFCNGGRGQGSITDDTDYVRDAEGYGDCPSVTLYPA